MVKANEGMIALQRGPIIYCIESVDQLIPGRMNLVIEKNEELQYEYQPELLNGVGVLKGKSFSAIPYYTWANREPCEMTVWIKESIKPRYPMDL
ncbi:MAG: hypothetical protein MZU84_01610 [Sphingobacterium sp.]|nr:hypothetical protein [Sphingobacterium sp.]